MKNCNKPIIFALLMVSILLASTGLAAATGPTANAVNAANPVNKIVIYGTFVPEAIEINAGESVTWVNFQRPKGPVVLLSEDGLWEETTLYYGKAFSYTFEEPGTYTLTLKDKTEIKGTVTVLSGRNAHETEDAYSRKVNPETANAAETGISAGKPLTREANPSPQAKLEKNGENEENSRAEEKKLVIYSTFVPEVVEVKEGDTVIWVNFKRPKAPLVLVSEDSLWEEATLHYGGAFSYTFEEAGTYTVSLENQPETKATVMVK